MPAQPPSTARVLELLDGESLEVITERAENDNMYVYAPELYAEAGRNGLRNVRLAMLSAGLESANRILDFASGNGRVLRYMRAAFPAAEITACDVLTEQVEFCVRTFGAVGVVGDEDPRKIALDGPYDVIWCGSLLTHVNEERWIQFVQLMESVLAPDGVFVFTVYGRDMAEGMRNGVNQASLTAPQIEAIVRDYDARGFGFQAFEDFWHGLGNAITTPSWVTSALLENAPALELLLYVETAWIGQDVIACTKRAA